MAFIKNDRFFLPEVEALEDIEDQVKTLQTVTYYNTEEWIELLDAVQMGNFESLTELHEEEPLLCKKSLEERNQKMVETMEKKLVEKSTSKPIFPSWEEFFTGGDLVSFGLMVQHFNYNKDAYEEFRNQQNTEIEKTSDSRTFFASIGASHFVGEKNILTLLSDRGFTITRIPLE